MKTIVFIFCGAINLSSNEVKILKLLINNSHQYLTRDLLNTELGLDYLSRSGDMQISRLRLKLKKECNLKDEKHPHDFTFCIYEK